MANEGPRHNTALCVIPPRDQWDSIEHFREANDKAFGRWPPHMNLIYPFVSPESLDATLKQILSNLRSRHSEAHQLKSHTVRLDSTDCFTHKHNSTIFLHDGDATATAQLRKLRDEIQEAMRQPAEEYRLHMTVGQSEAAPGSDAHKFALAKASALPAISWEAKELAILVRDPNGAMQPWATLNLETLSLDRTEQMPFYDDDTTRPKSRVQAAQRYSKSEGLWVSSSHQQQATPSTPIMPEHLVLSSYNTQADFTWPSPKTRFPLLIKNLLLPTALADILVLQEVTDDFLSHLLEDDEIRQRYEYASHAPSSQPSSGPLPNFLNVVILSKYRFTWRYLPSRKRHKGSCIAVFDRLGTTSEDGSVQPLVVAGCHLTQGLTDDNVKTKLGEFQDIVSYLRENHASSPWVTAGDFNVPTSFNTIQTALRAKTISNQTAENIQGFDHLVSQAGLVDAWSVARTEVGESSDDMKQASAEIFEGEQGSTFDPPSNPRAAESVVGKLSDRPQRYDRILCRLQDDMHCAAFNMFGFLADSPKDDGAVLGPRLASDHWGIRCLLRKQTGSLPAGSRPAGLSVVPVSLKSAPDGLSDTEGLRDLLREKHLLPTTEDEQTREKALGLLREALSESGPSASRGQVVTVKVVPVGSYGLGTWSPSSDLDCLCLGTTSSSLTLQLARSKIRQRPSDMRVLRTVRARTGTMLELEVLGIKVDLHFCQAAHIAETWPEAMKRPASDPIFSLKSETLQKLKPARDLFYLKRSIPDLAQYRLAHQVIRSWAKERGIYAAKFGYLGGIHISVLLVRVCKMVYHEKGLVSTPDILATFFDHYAGFDWVNQAAFDPFFHKNLRYHRAFREPLCLLGWHAPALNAAATASKPNVQAIATEFQRANELLSKPDATWSSLLGGRESDSQHLISGTADFLKSYPSYIRLSVQYWGKSLERGSKLLGWLESRCISLLVDLRVKVKGLSVRIWPQRFVDKSLEDQTDNYQGVYLIGLARDEADDSTAANQQDMEATLSALRTSLDLFERRIREDEKYFDSSISWFDASVVRSAKLGQLEPDLREWGRYIEEEEEEDDDEYEFVDTAAEDDQNHDDAPNTVTTHRPVATPKPEGAAKLRSALDVMYRLRWDPNMDSDDYVVGYLDRFEGVQEKAMASWKSEQTHEEFIPQHRIVYFKRKSDSTIVWERATRTDKIFGSG